MIYLLDTNIIAELMKPAPDQQVIVWMNEHQADSGLSVLTIGEIANGIEALPEGKRKNELSRRLRFVQEDYVERILPIDTAVAWEWARHNQHLHAVGIRPSTMDSLIAATALVSALIVVTRNTKHFPLISTVNPFER